GAWPPGGRPADRGLPAAAPARAAALADRGYLADERRSRSLPGTAVAARVASPRDLRDRSPAARVHRRQRAVPNSRSVSRPGHVAGAQARPRGGIGRRRGASLGPPGPGRGPAWPAAPPPRGPRHRPSPPPPPL